MLWQKGLNTSPNNKISDFSASKAYVENQLQVAETMMFSFERVENIEVKGENAGYQNCLLFPSCTCIPMPPSIPNKSSQSRLLTSEL